MPFINMQTSAKIEKKVSEELSKAFGKAIEIFPGKSEKWLMVRLEGDQDMYLSGSADPAAILNVTLYSTSGLDSEVCGSFTACVTDIVSEKLNIPKDRIYVAYAATPEWGWNGANF